jgi:hypothetical protein
LTGDQGLGTGFSIEKIMEEALKKEHIFPNFPVPSKKYLLRGCFKSIWL